MSKKYNDRLFGKWNELVLLLIGFALTGIIGGLISWQIQNRLWDHQYAETTKREEIANAQKIFDEISSLMDSRSYLTRRLVWAYTGEKTKNVINKRFIQYDEILYDWNLNLNKRLSLIDRYFGTSSRLKFEFEIHHKFRFVSAKIDSLIRVDSKSFSEFKKAQDMIDPINTTMYAYNTELLDRIKLEQVGKYLDE